MPTYEYKCPNGHDFEKFYRSISAAAGEVDCPVCGARAERQMSAGGGLLFKGSGFYITDYGKDGKKDQRANTPAAPEGGAAAKPSESKSDGGASKPAPPSSPPAAKSGE
jgi:putative FmdB family regulatory protein